MVIVHGQGDLLEVVDALGAPGGLARRLHCRQQQGDQHGDDRDDDQQLDQRETASASGPLRIHGVTPAQEEIDDIDR